MMREEHRQTLRLFLMLWAMCLLPIHGVIPPVDTLSSCPMIELDVERLPDLVLPRMGHRVIVSGDEIIAVGGHSKGFIPTNTAEYYSDGEWHLIPTVYAHDNGTSVMLSNGKVLIAGGHEQHLGIGQTYPVEMYDPSNHTFDGFGSLDMKRVFANALEIDSGKVIIAGNWYHDDEIEIYDGNGKFHFVKKTDQDFSSPFIFRTSRSNLMIFGSADSKGKKINTVKAEQRYGSPIDIPLFKTWHPIQILECFSNEESFIGDIQKGIFSYLLPVKNDSGQLAIAKSHGTSIELLPTTFTVPMQSPFGTNIIYYSHVIVDKAKRCGYICGMDSSYHHYVLRLEYNKGVPVPITLYYTKPVMKSGGVIPKLSNDGNLVLVGGGDATNLSNYHPSSTFYVLHIGTPLSATQTHIPWWLWLLISIFACLFILLFLLWYQQKKKSGSTQEAWQTSHEESGSTAHNSENISYKAQKFSSKESAHSLMLRLHKVMEKKQLYLISDLKLSDVSKALDTSSRTLSDNIRKIENCSFNQYVNRFRIHHAQELLLNVPDIKLVTVSEESGFSNETTFFRTFKLFTGMTPREWISQHTPDGKDVTDIVDQKEA